MNPTPISCPDISPGSSPWRLYATRISGIRDEMPDVRTYTLDFTEPAVGRTFQFVPGQFNMISLPGIGEAAISIVAVPENHGRVAHTVRAVGNVTQALTRLEVGDEVLLRGPFGTPWPLDTLLDRDLVIVAGGLGLASLQAVICHCMAHREDFGRISVLHGAKASSEFLYAGDHSLWRDYGIDVLLVVDHPDGRWHGPVGRVPTLLNRLDLDAASTSLFCCGPEAMMRSVAEAALDRGIRGEHVSLAVERNMGCGTGLCGLCQLGPFFVCKDGPVFSYDRIARWLAVPHL